MRGTYRLTPRGCVGVIDALTTRIDIEPKIPLANVLHLLDPDGALAVPPLTAGRAPRGLIEALAGRLMALLMERVAAGLRPGYVEREDALPYLRGRLNVSAQVRAAQDKLHCRFDDFSVDTPWNRQVKAVVRLLFDSRLVGSEIEINLRHALSAFSEVSDETASDAALGGWLDEPLISDYRPLIELSRVLCAALDGRGVRPAFLIDLERVFERYIARGLWRFFAGGDVQVEAQPWLTLDGPTPPGWPPLGLRPDIVLRRDGRSIAVIDVKWKRLTRGPEVDDLHQALAYARLLETGRAVLVYPGACNWRHEYDAADTRLGLHRLRVVGLPERCNAALARWAARLMRETEKTA